ncbi:MAG: hypothetical protein NVS4B8_22920 [Herpetosiphon sp.]
MADTTAVLGAEDAADVFCGGLIELAWEGLGAGVVGCVLTCGGDVCMIWLGRVVATLTDDVAPGPHETTKTTGTRMSAILRAKRKVVRNK